MAVLINGNGYTPVTAQQDADLYAGIMGNNTVVLNVGQNMAAQVINANTVRILDGEVLSQGRRIHLDAGEYDDFTIPSGSQGVTSRYIIGYHIFTDGSGNELVETFVEQIANASDTIVENQLRDGATESYISMYRVTVIGVSISTPTPLYTTRPPYIVRHGQTSDTITVQPGSYNDHSVYFYQSPFPSTPTVVVCLQVVSAYSDIGNMEIVTTEVSATQFRVRIYNNGSTAKTVRYNYIAILTV